jgi:hypothetical protein
VAAEALTAAVAVEAFMGEAEASTAVGVEAEAFTEAVVLAVADSVTVVAEEDITEAAPTAARGLLAEEVTTEAEAFVVDRRRVVTERAGVQTEGSAHRAA